MPTRAESPWPVRLGLALTVLIYLAYSSFGIACPYLWGHHGYHGATYMLRAKMTLRFHMITPATWAGFDYPPRFSWYFHHPIGYHHLLDLPLLVFGDHEWLARAVAALGGLAVLAALYRLVNRWWSREFALLACAVWIALPIVCSFSVLSDPMFPEMACSILLVDLFLRYLAEPARKLFLQAAAVIVAGGLLMWEVYFQVAFQGLAALVWVALGRRQGRARAGLVWILSTGFAAAATMAFHFAFTWKMGMAGDFQHSYGVRSTANFDYVYQRHKLWLELLYGWPLLGIGIAWLAVFLMRFAAGRARLRDQAVLIFFQINVIYVYLFREASSVHLYRVFWFSSFLTLAVTDLVWELAQLLQRFAPKRLVAVGALVVSAGYFAVELPHSYRNLIESREKMGTHGPDHYDADYAKQLFAMEVARRTGPEDFVFVHSSISKRIEFYYYMDRSNLDIGSLAQLPGLLLQHKRSLVLIDANPAPAEKQRMRELLRHHPGYQFDHYLLIDLRSDKPEFHEYEFQPKRPTPGWRWWVSHKYPPMQVVEVRHAWRNRDQVVELRP